MTTKIMIMSFLTNLLLGLIKVIGGFFTHSMTLLSDGVHCLSDMGTDVVGIIGSKIASKEPDESHPFGHGKMEYVTSMLMSLLIIVLGLTILVNSFKTNESVTSAFAIIILFVCIIIKIILSRYLLKKGRELNNEILLTNGYESKYDSFSSMFGLVFVILGLFKAEFSFLKYADIVGSVIISMFTLKIGISLFIKNIKSVIGEVDNNAERKEALTRIVLKNKSVLGIKRLTILKYGHYDSVIVEIKMDENVTLKKFSIIEKRIKTKLKDYDKAIKYATVNIEPIKNIKD